MPAEIQPSQPTSRAEWWAAGLILLAAALWRLYGLGAESLWTDEIAAVLVGRRSLLEVLVSIGVQDVNPPLFYLLMHFWTALGEPEWWLRLLPALCGLAAVALTWRLGRRLAGPTVGLLAALFTALSPLSVYLSRELRYHTLATMLALAAWLIFVRRLDDPRAGRRRWLIALLALGLYTHYYFLFVLAVAAVWWWSENEDRPVPARRSLAPLGAALLIFLPWLIVMGVQAARASYRFRPLTGLFATLFDLAGYSTVGQADTALPLDPYGLAKLWFLLALAPFWLLAGLGLSQWRNERATRLATLGLGVPILCVLVVSRVAPVYGHRYFLPFLPLFLILLAIGARRLLNAWKPLGVIAIVAVCGLMAASDLEQRTDTRYQREDWRTLAQRLRAALGPHDVILGYNAMQIGPLNYYWLRQTGRPLVYAPLLTGDPLIFAPQPPGAVEARVELYRQRFERLWVIDHFAHMYDPPGVARAELDRTAVYDPSVDFSACCRIPVRVYWRDRVTPLLRAGRTFGDAIDFTTRAFDALQLSGDWSRPDHQWAWIGAAASVVLHAKKPVDGILLRVWYSPRFHHRQPVTLTLEKDDAPLNEWDLNEDGPRELRVHFTHELPAGSIVSLTLRTSRTFDPAREIGGADHTPKSIMVQRVGLE
jgi:hypothetical protein